MERGDVNGVSKMGRIVLERVPTGDLEMNM